MSEIELRTTIEDAKKALGATEHEGVLLAALRVKEKRDEWREIAEQLCDAAAYGLAQWDDGYSLKVCQQIGDAILRFRRMKKEEEA